MRKHKATMLMMTVESVLLKRLLELSSFRLLNEKLQSYLNNWATKSVILRQLAKPTDEDESSITMRSTTAKGGQGTAHNQKFR